MREDDRTHDLGLFPMENRKQATINEAMRNFQQLVSSMRKTRKLGPYLHKRIKVLDAR